MHVVGTAGHVDHGKSSLVHRLTGTDPDRWDEEKRRGLTIDLGFASLELPSGATVGIIDVPGHERFIRNMLAGAGGITMTMFVVSAPEGWMPQSSEHLAILNALGVSAGVVALTKSDAADDTRVAATTSVVRERLIGSALEGARIIPCSSFTGEGLTELVAALDELVQVTLPAPDEGLPRLWVDRVFTIAGAGTVVTGTLTGGTLQAGEEVVASPGGRRVRIRAIQSHGRDLDEAPPGTRVALNLSGAGRHQIRRGDAIVRAGGWLETDGVDAVIRPAAQEARDRGTFLPKGAYTLFTGSAETPVRSRLLATGGEDDDTAYAHLVLGHRLPLRRGDRFVLRDAGRRITWGGGEVLDPSPGRGPATARIGLLRELEGATPDDAVLALVEHVGRIPVQEALLRAAAPAVPHSAHEVGGVLLSRTEWQKANDLVAEALGRHHAAHPLERGLPREELRQVLGMQPGPFAALLDASSRVSQEGALVRLTEHRVALTEGQERERARILEILDASPYSPPPATSLGADPALLRVLVEAGEVVRIGDFYLSRRAVGEAVRRVRAALEQSGPLTVAAIRDLLGTTRRYAVPLCEWLDAQGITRRRGDLRVAGPARMEEPGNPGF